MTTAGLCGTLSVEDLLHESETSMTTRSETNTTYEISLSNESYEINGWYPPESDSYGFSFYSYKPYSGIDRYVLAAAKREGADLREAVIAWAEKNYGARANTQNGSYSLKETTHTVTFLEEKSKKETLVVQTESTHVIVFHESFRTEAETEEFYLKPRREYEAGAPERDARFAKQLAESKAERELEEAAELARLAESTPKKVTFLQRLGLHR